VTDAWKSHGSTVSTQRTIVLSVAGLIVIVGLLALAVFILPSQMVTAADVPVTVDRLKAQNDIRTTLLQSLAGLALLVGAVFTARTYALNKQGQITDRFTKAIGQLGERDRLDVRVGAIYALERIARDSERDYGPIMAVLSAFLHVTVPASGFDARSDSHRRPPADVEAALTVISRRDRRHDLKEATQDAAILYPSLSDLDLWGVFLFGDHLEGLRLHRTHLEYAGLDEVHLEGARLHGAILRGAKLRGAHLDEARFEPFGDRASSADLSGAKLQGASLRRANLKGANLEGADLRGANLQGASLEGADLQGALAGNLEMSTPGGTKLKRTIWPAGFDPAQHGVRIVE
jgi:hypothetical protein